MISKDLLVRLHQAVDHLEEVLGPEILGIAYHLADGKAKLDVFILLTERPQGPNGDQIFARRQSAFNRHLGPLISEIELTFRDYPDFWKELCDDKYTLVDFVQDAHVMKKNGITVIAKQAMQHRASIINRKLDAKAFKAKIVEAIGRDIFTVVSIHDETEKLADDLREKLGDELIGITLLKRPDTEKNKEEEAQAGDEKKPHSSSYLLVITSDLPADEDLGRHIQRRKQIVEQSLHASFNHHELEADILHQQGIWDATLKAVDKYVQAIGEGLLFADQGLLKQIQNVYQHMLWVTNRFSEYVISYVIAGSIVRGQANSESDIDVFVVINDTDVKNMTRSELKYKLREMIVRQAAEIHTKINVQTYLLTDYWEFLKDGAPAIYTLLRDGVQLHDPTGMFLTWKQLLLEGRLRPSREHMYALLNAGETLLQKVQKKLREICSEDLYYSVLSPMQAVLIKLGHYPTDPKDTIALARQHLTNLMYLSEKDVETVEFALSLRKDIEHDTECEVGIAIVQELLERATIFNDRINACAEHIEILNQWTELERLQERIAQVTAQVTRGDGTHTRPLKPESVAARLVSVGFLPRSLKDDFTLILSVSNDETSESLMLEDLQEIVFKAKGVLLALYETYLIETSAVALLHN